MEESTKSYVDDSDRPYDALVLGAGISGLVSASILLKDGCRRVLVVDEYDRPGGNHIDCAIGDMSFDVGSYIFQDDSPLLRHFPELLPLYVEIAPTWGRLNPQGVVTTYPISIRDDVVKAGPIEWLRMGLSVAGSRLLQRRMRNAKEFASYWIGPYFLHRSGLGHYMERFYGLPPEKIDIRFAEKRMLWIKEHASLGFLLRRLRQPFNPPGPTNTQLARPKEGFARLYQAAVQRLEREGVVFVFGTKLDRLQKQAQGFRLETATGTYVSQRVVSTIPLDRILSLSGNPMRMTLSTVTLISLFFSFSGERGFTDAILYNFSHGGAWKRLTVYSDFYGRSEGREYFTAEVNADHVQGSVAIAEENFRRHVTANGLFKGDLRLEGSHVLENAYPIYTDRADEQAAAIMASLRASGIETLGRQGAFDYQPTARDTTLKAEAALKPN